MDFFQKKPLIVFHAVTPAAIDLAARIGLSTPELVWPAAVPDDGELPAGRPLLLIGRDNARLPAGSELAPLASGCGAVTRVGGDLLVWGRDAVGEALACLWAAACWDGELAEDEYIVTPDSLAALPTARPAGPRREWPQRSGFACLTQTFTPDGLLTSRDGAFPDDTSVRFELASGLSRKEFAAVLDLAARIGAESTGLRFPLGNGPRPAVRVGLDEGDGWLRLTDDGLSVGAGPRLAAALTYLARRFPEMPGDDGWLAWDVWAVKDALGRKPAGEPAAVLDEAWQDDGEEARFRASWNEEILPELAAKAADRTGWKITVTLSEPRDIRAKLTAEITASLAAAGFSACRVVVRPAFKQGYYWLTDEVLPALAALRPERVVVGWRRFTEAGVRDLPLRWLQEVYPADEVLAGSLGAAVELAELTGEGPALEVRAYRGGAEICADAMTPASLRQPYLDNSPAEGLACCPTGRIEAGHPREGLPIARPFATDLERFWQWYSAVILTKIENTVADGAAEPLFGTLAVEYSGSEPEERLGVEQEIASPLEALHEDIYFTTLDRFAALGKARRGEAYEAPGAILPWLKATPGRPPRARVTVTRPVRRETGAVNIIAIHLDGRVQTDDGITTCTPPARPVPLAATAGPVGPEELAGRLAALAAAGIRVRIAARSTGGQPVYALELPAAGGIYGAGAALRRPTLLINARHHGNEVASTTAALALAQELSQCQALRAKVNIVIVPLENMDGARLHDRMQRDNPEWKLHAARYNIGGCEFYGEYFKAQTPFTEAQALSRLWRQWLPDVVLDAHGVPSHEWLQCFSGFGSPPRFKVSFWLPNALIYGILLEPQSEAGNLAAGGALARVLAAAFAADDEIHALNRGRLARYRRYGYDNLPAKFPVELMDDAVFYRQDGAERKISFTWWRPEVTAVHCVTEVADETAQGEYLGLCVRAQAAAMQAAAEWLAAQPAALSEGCERAGGQIRRWRKRTRAQETAGEARA